MSYVRPNIIRSPVECFLLHSNAPFFKERQVFLGGVIANNRQLFRDEDDGGRIQYGERLVAPLHF